MNFSSSQADNSLFLRKSSHSMIMILIYVDDILVTGSSTQEIEQVVSQVSANFSLKDLGEIHNVLGMKVQRSEKGMFLSQQREEDMANQADPALEDEATTPLKDNKQSAKVGDTSTAKRNLTDQFADESVTSNKGKAKVDDDDDGNLLPTNGEEDF
ncbi:Uncharacterized mitochondrial protein AtMg00810 [Striga hermonthica]|uniref:Uncharacterized mitochondrial protein AtMg00810 n=1 Tax=Striga hermonthica TaxID=68872 RepID=A0A9N7RIU6_STRHE|nr:Uncharacterized mitochondrial protein AtMg00810 [Striga hermonthica]